MTVSAFFFSHASIFAHSCDVTCFHVLTFYLLLVPVAPLDFISWLESHSSAIAVPAPDCALALAAGLLAPDLGITTFPLSGWPQGPPRCPATSSHQRQQGTHRQPTFLWSASRGTSETSLRIGSVTHPPPSSYSSTELSRGIGREPQSHIFLQWHFTPAPSTSLRQDHISQTPGASAIAQVLPQRG